MSWRMHVPYSISTQIFLHNISRLLNLEMRLFRMYIGYWSSGLLDLLILVSAFQGRKAPEPRFAFSKFRVRVGDSKDSVRLFVLGQLNLLNCKYCKTHSTIPGD